MARARDRTSRTCRASIGCSGRPVPRTAVAAAGRSRKPVRRAHELGGERRAPDGILAQGGVGAPTTRTRPLCPYPKTAVYNGTGNSDDAANFHCGGDLESPEIVCADLLTKYKREVKGPLDFSGSGVNRHVCAQP